MNLVVFFGLLCYNSRYIGVVDMLILPIVNKRRVMNVQIRLKDASKVRRGVCYDDAGESEIIVNREKFSE